MYQRVLLPYPCHIWSSERDALARANSEYTEALKEAQTLEQYAFLIEKFIEKNQIFPILEPCEI